MGGIGVVLIGLIIIVIVDLYGGKYVGFCILFFGSYVFVFLIVVWFSGNILGMCNLLEFLVCFSYFINMGCRIW